MIRLAKLQCAKLMEGTGVSVEAIQLTGVYYQPFYDSVYFVVFEHLADGPLEQPRNINDNGSGLNASEQSEIDLSLY